MDAEYSLLPSHMQPGFQRWIEDGIVGGDFMMAVLRNEFADAVTRADSTNRMTLVSYAHFLHTCPPTCWGSAEKVDAWARHKGLKGEGRAEN